MSGLTDLTAAVTAANANLTSIQSALVQLQASITTLQGNQGDSDAAVEAQAQALATVNTGLQGVVASIQAIVTTLGQGSTPTTGTTA